MMKQNQKGISLTGFLITLAVVGFALFIGMKLFPMYQEYWALKKALKSVAADDAVGSDGISIRNSLEKYFDVGYITGVNAKDITVERAPEGVLITADYEIRKPLIYNLDIVGKFKASEIKRPGAQ